MFKLSCLASILFLGVGACAHYQWGPGRSSVRGDDKVPEKIEKIFIPVANNLSTRSQLEGPLTEEFRESWSLHPNWKIVSRAEDADFLMLLTIENFEMTRGGGVYDVGTQAGEKEGGLKAKRSTASDIKISTRIRATLLEKVSTQEGLHHELWNKLYPKDKTFEAVHTTSNVRNTPEKGLTSAPHIHDSRAEIHWRILSREVAEGLRRELSARF